MGKRRSTRNGKEKEYEKWEREGVQEMGKRRSMRNGKEKEYKKWEREGV